MPGAGYAVVFDEALVERTIGVGTDVAQGVVGAVHVMDGNDVVVGMEQFGFAGLDVCGGTCGKKLGHRLTGFL